MSEPLATVTIRGEHDVVLARQRARQIAALLGLDPQQQTRVATAVSELCRNAFEYAGGGKVEYLVDDRGEPRLTVRVRDAGPGIADLDAVLSGRYRSSTGMGVGIVGARRLMDGFEIDSGAGGTTVEVWKRLSALQLPTSKELAALAAALARQVDAGPLGELQAQNRELVRTLDELQARQEELARLNRELEETNRGVVALYAELDERATELRRANETKSRFLSSVSHELRTPLSSMLALSDLLLNRVDGPLTDEQERQVRYLRAAAESLLRLVNDLLDLARIEAGKTAVQPSTFSVADLFGSLRGMFRPLHRNEDVALVFEEADDLPPLHTDETKLAQVLRNFVSNALRFTAEGEVRVTARLDDAGTAVFAVADTGVGIAAGDQERIFEEFVQLDEGAAGTGTGLGLAVSRRLAELLGGSVAVRSEPGVGSTFSVAVPVVYAGVEEPLEVEERPAPAAHGSELEGRTVLVVDDEETTRYIVRRTLAARGCRVLEAADGAAGLGAAGAELPDAVVLDLRMPELDGLSVLRALRDEPATASIPVVIFTGVRLAPDERELVERLAAAALDKNEVGGEQVAAAVALALSRVPAVAR